MALHLTPALQERLEHLASEAHRSPDDLAQEVMENYLTEQEDLRAALHEAEDQIDRGEFLTHEEVFARINKLLADG